MFLSMVIFSLSIARWVLYFRGLWSEGKHRQPLNLIHSSWGKFFISVHLVQFVQTFTLTSNNSCVWVMYDLVSHGGRVCNLMKLLETVWNSSKFTIGEVINKPFTGPWEFISWFGDVSLENYSHAFLWTGWTFDPLPFSWHISSCWR
jgi:hypothetical protein